MNNHQHILMQAGGIQARLTERRVNAFRKTGLRPNRTVILIGRNEPCPCQSGKKFKRCCLDKAKKRAA